MNIAMQICDATTPFTNRLHNWITALDEMPPANGQVKAATGVISFTKRKL